MEQTTYIHASEHTRVSFKHFDKFVSVDIEGPNHIISLLVPNDCAHKLIELQDVAEQAWSSTLHDKNMRQLSLTNRYDKENNHGTSK